MPRGVCVIRLLYVPRGACVIRLLYVPRGACVIRLLYAKRKELSDAANKLKNGLSKIDETREKVQTMSGELEEARANVAVFQKQCEEFLVIIVQQKRDADEQQKV